MAYQEIILPEMEYGDRIVRVSVFADSTLALTTPTKHLIEQIGDSSERIDVVAGLYEVQNVDIRAVENYDNEAEGFWMRVFSGSETPIVHIYLDEGSGDIPHCTGKAILNADSWKDECLEADGTASVRTVTFKVADVLTVFQDVSVDDVAAECLNHTITDRLFQSTPMILSFSYSSAGTATVGYRVAACTESDEDIWSSEVITNTAPLGWGTVTVHWAAVAGADHYVIYRTTDTISHSIGKVGTVSSSFTSFTDTGANPTDITQKSRLYVRIKDIFASMIKVAFGDNFNSDNAIITENINNLRYSSATVTSVNAGGLYVNTDSMTVGNELYWGKRYKSAWELMLSLSKCFALIPRHFLDTTTEFYTHKIEFLTRENSYATLISFSGKVMESTLASDCTAKIKSVETHRANGSNVSNVGYPINAENYDLSIPCEYVAGNSVGVSPTSGGTIRYGGYTISKLYVSSTDGFSSGKAFVSVGNDFNEIEYTGIGADGSSKYLANVTSSTQFESSGNIYPGDPRTLAGEMLHTFNGTGIEDITDVSFWNAETGSMQSETSAELHLAALRDYLRYRLTTRKQMYHREYGNMSAVESGILSHNNVRICKRIQISNGLSSSVYYASEVTKSLMNNTSNILWFEE